MTKKELKQKRALSRIFNQSKAYHDKAREIRNEERIKAEIDWIRNNLSPTGGKVAFRKTQKEQMTRKPRSGWLTKDD